jgi:PIN domain nuclease of toxin-antitoxin system
MKARLLLDTHILIRWLQDPRRLSKEQSRAMNEASRRQEPFAICASTLLEIALLAAQRRLDLGEPLADFFDVLEASPEFELLPLSCRVAAEAGALAALRDPVDRAIVATARVHALRLVTSDQRILESGLAMTV